MANSVQISGNFETEGFVEQRKELEKILMSNPDMEKKVQDIVRQVLAVVRSNMTQAARSSMVADPRQANKAVRTMVYKRLLGGNVNILNKKRASSSGGSYQPTRTIKDGQRGGNRRLRSERTMKLESYYGSDRGFILRFLNAGTNNRDTKYGSRGAIAPRNWFGNRSQHEMENAAERLTQYIDQLIKDTIGNG